MNQATYQSYLDAKEAEQEQADRAEFERLKERFVT